MWCRQGLKRLGGERGCHGQRVSGFGNVCRGGVWRNDAVLQVPEPGAYLPRAVALTALIRRWPSFTATSVTSHTPSANSGISDAAASSASLVLPLPPGPVSVTMR